MNTRLCITVVALAFVLVGGDRLRPAWAADPLELYAIVPQTGPVAFYGQTIEASIRAQAQAINAAGGVDGRPVHFTVLDSQASPQTAVQLATSLLSRAVPVIVDAGPAATGNATTALAKQSALVFCLSTAYTPQPGTYSFSTPFSLEDAPAAQVRFFRSRRLKRLAFLTTTDSTGQAAEAAISRILAYPENRDVVAVGRERFGTVDIGVSAQLAKLRAGDPQAAFVLASGTPLGVALRDMRDAGMVMPTATLASNNSAQQILSYGASVPPDLEIVTPRFGAYDAMLGGPVKERISSFRAAMRKNGVGLDGPSALSWDPIELIVGAYRKNGAKATPATLYASIAALRGVPGINGFYDFVTTPGRGLTVKDAVVLQWSGTRTAFVPISTAGGAAKL